MAAAFLGDHLVGLGDVARPSIGRAAVVHSMAVEALQVLGGEEVVTTDLVAIGVQELLQLGHCLLVADGSGLHPAAGLLLTKKK